VVFAGVFVSLLLAWGALRLRGQRWADVGLRGGITLRRVLVVTIMSTAGLLILTAVLESLLSAATGSKPDVSKFDVLRGNVAVLIVGLCLVWTSAAFGEEMLCRGFLMHSLHDLFGRGRNSRLSWALALLLSSAAFGAAHAYQGAAGMILTGLIGLGFGLVYFASKRNLWPAILTHGLFDTLSFLVVFLSWDKLIAPSAALVSWPGLV
jgi:membrane protease YdiL (CAAX protease family)